MKRGDVVPFREIDSVLRRDWALLVRSLHGNPTLLPDWVEIAAEETWKSGANLSVYVDRSEDGTLVGVLPFFISDVTLYGLPVRRLEPASNLMSYHADLLTARDPAGFLESFLDAAPPWDLFHVSALKDFGVGQAALNAVAQRRALHCSWWRGEVSPYLPIEGTWDVLIASKSKKFRYKIRRRREWLSGHPSARVEWFGKNSDTSKLLKDMLHIESMSWKSREGRDITSRPKQRGYYRALLPLLQRLDALLGNILYIDDQPVAYNLCCHFEGWVGQMKTSFDERFGELSPGALVIDLAIQAAFDLEATEFDFLGDSAIHKLHWTDHSRTTLACQLFGSTFRGRVASAVKRVAWLSRKPRDGGVATKVPPVKTSSNE